MKQVLVLSMNGKMEKESYTGKLTDKISEILNQNEMGVASKNIFKEFENITGIQVYVKTKIDISKPLFVTGKDSKPTHIYTDKVVFVNKNTDDIDIFDIMEINRFLKSIVRESLFLNDKREIIDLLVFKI